MGTVGEMVNALGAQRAPAVTREIDYDDFRNCRLTYDELVAVYIGLLSNLRDLGIWDAEVLEFTLRPGTGPDGLSEDDWLEVDNGAWHIGDLMQGVDYGQRVRVIVLPKEEG